MNKKYFIVVLLSILTAACQNSEQLNTSNRKISSMDSNHDTATTISNHSMTTGDHTSVIGAANRSAVKP